MLASRRLLVSLRIPPLRRPIPPTTAFRRDFSFTPRSQAAENPDSIIASFQGTKLFKQLADKPEALSALQDLAQLMKANGVEPNVGKPPTTMQMLRLAANPDFREKAKRVVEELQKAGIDLKSNEAMQEIMNMRGSGKPEGNS